MRTQNSSAVEQILPQVKKRSVALIYKDILIGLLLLATPFLLFPDGYNVCALLLLPTIWLIRWVVVGSIIPRTPVDWPILLLLMMVLVSLWATFDVSFSIGKIASLLLGIVVFYAMIDLAQTQSALRTVITFFILCGVGIAIISALGTRWVDKFPLLQPFLDQLPSILRGVRQAEKGFSANQVGGVLIFFIPLQVVLLSYWLKKAFLRPFRSEKETWPVNAGTHEAREGRTNVTWAALFTGGSLLITVGMLFLTQSRGAIGGLAVGLVVIAAIRTRWGKILAGLGLITVLATIQAGGVFNDLVTSGLETEVVGTISLAGRLEIWSRAVEGLADFPLGMGMNNFRRVMPILYPAFSIPLNEDIAHAHNHLLQAGLDLGIPGLIAYLALWLGAGFLLAQIVLRSRDQFYRSVALGLIGSLTAYFVYGLADAVALGAKPGFVFWWALGLVVATHHLFYQSELLS